ncbi:hypothetical protein CE91St58_55190 [Lachnospiraceae bacterium]|nr:hypothetical protein CE91St58_55190 [Lachnospiraceae bacterium]
MFLNVPFRREYATLSGQSAAFRRLKRLNEEFCRVGRLPAERNIKKHPVFEAGYENIPAAAPGEKQAGDKDGRERPAAEIFLRPHTPLPCARHPPVLQSIEERRNQHGRRKSKKDIA